ncbi:MAG: hypothetical protein PHG53_04155 [Phycisphaerae bacterium]|nr:hypothetical protein [Phycisphaerae bacterium]
MQEQLETAINSDLRCTSGGCWKNQSKPQQVKSKNPFFHNFFTPFPASSYEGRATSDDYNFRINRAGSFNYGGRCVLSALVPAMAETMIVCAEGKNQSK